MDKVTLFPFSPQNCITTINCSPFITVPKRSGRSRWSPKWLTAHASWSSSCLTSPLTCLSSSWTPLLRPVHSCNKRGSICWRFHSLGIFQCTQYPPGWFLLRLSSYPSVLSRQAFLFYAHKVVWYPGRLLVFGHWSDQPVSNLKRFSGLSLGLCCSFTSFSHLSSQSSCYLCVLFSYAYFLPSRPQVNKRYTQWNLFTIRKKKRTKTSRTLLKKILKISSKRPRNNEEKKYNQVFLHTVLKKQFTDW